MIVFIFVKINTKCSEKGHKVLFCLSASQEASSISVISHKAFEIINQKQREIPTAMRGSIRVRGRDQWARLVFICDESARYVFFVRSHFLERRLGQ